MKIVFIALVITSVALVGCTATEGEAESSTTSVASASTTNPPETTAATSATTTQPATTTASAANPTTIPPGPEEPFPPEDLTANSWRVGLYFQTYHEDGTWEVREQPELERFDGGTWELDGAELTMTSETGPTLCGSGRVGRYFIEWAADRARIDVTLIDDTCAGRRDLMIRGLTPVDR